MSNMLGPLFGNTQNFWAETFTEKPMPSELSSLTHPKDWSTADQPLIPLNPNDALDWIPDFAFKGAEQWFPVKGDRISNLPLEDIKNLRQNQINREFLNQTEQWMREHGVPVPDASLSNWDDFPLV